MIEELCLLLKVFYELTKPLSGEKYSTLVDVFPLLRMVKAILSNRNLFIGDYVEGPLSAKDKMIRETHKD